MSGKEAAAIVMLRKFITESAPEPILQYRLGDLEVLQRAIEVSNRPLPQPLPREALDEVTLKVPQMHSGTEAQINQAWHHAEEMRTAMENRRVGLEAIERNARFALGDEWLKAKSGDIRQQMVHNHLWNSEAYAEARGDYERARHNFKLAMMEVERVRMLADMTTGAV